MLRKTAVLLAIAGLGIGAAIGIAACGEDREGEVQFQTETTGTGTTGTGTTGTTTTGIGTTGTETTETAP